MIALLAGFGLLAVAGVFVGIWNLKTLQTTARPPLLAAIAVSSIFIVLTVLFISAPFNNQGITGMLILHALVGAWTIGILRLKKVPVPDPDTPDNSPSSASSPPTSNDIQK